MFAVIFEVRPQDDQRPTYLETAKMLRPELEQVDGFVSNIRYGSLTRERLDFIRSLIGETKNRSSGGEHECFTTKRRSKDGKVFFSIIICVLARSPRIPSCRMAMASKNNASMRRRLAEPLCR